MFSKTEHGVGKVLNFSSKEIGCKAIEGIEILKTSILKPICFQISEKIDLLPILSLCSFKSKRSSE